MIYLIQSAAFIGDTNDTEIILKIGYCGEDSKKARFNVYLTENPTRKVLYLIPGGTEQDERNLHYHFRDFKKPYGREWFTYSPEILEFFQSHTTKESLETLKVKLEARMKAKLKEENPEVKIWVKSIMEVVYKDSDLIKKQEISEDLLNDSLVNHKNLQDYIQSRFPDSYKEIEEAYEELTKPLSPKIQECLEKFNSITTFEDKLKYIQKAELELDSYELELFLNQIEPRKFKDYYKVFGSAKLKALKYREADILREWNNLVNNFYKQGDVSSLIYMNFIVGNSYSSSEVKKTLKRIYEDCNYQKTPKATDLNEYFETKEAKIVDSEGKKSRGIKLLNKKRVD